MSTSRFWLTVMALALALAAPALADEAGDKEKEARPSVFGPETSFDPGSGVMAREDGRIHVDGAPFALRSQGELRSGVLVPDGHGGYVWLGSDDRPPMPDPALENARELRLRIRELADQLLTGDGAALMQGMIALPTSFVNQDNLESSSSFGRLVAEQMFHEFSRRGVSVREYRAMPLVETRPGEGDFALTRDPKRVAAMPAGALVVAGTYYQDKFSIFVNARVYRATDHLVLRTAEIVMPQSDMTRIMLAKGTGIRLHSAEMDAKSFSEMKERPNIGYALMEEDLH